MAEADKKPADWFARVVSVVAIVASLVTAIVQVVTARDIAKLQAAVTENVAKANQEAVREQARADVAADLRRRRVDAYQALWKLGVMDEALVVNELHKDWKRVHTDVAAATEVVRYLGPKEVADLIEPFVATLQPPFDKDKYYRAKEPLIQAMQRVGGGSE
jgi:hypothetical protein